MLRCRYRKGAILLDLAGCYEVRTSNRAKSNLTFRQRTDGKNDHLAPDGIELRLIAADDGEQDWQTKDSILQGKPTSVVHGIKMDGCRSSALQARVIDREAVIALADPL